MGWRHGENPTAERSGPAPGRTVVVIVWAPARPRWADWLTLLRLALLVVQLAQLVAPLLLR